MANSWLVLLVMKVAKVDLPEAGIPAIPTSRRELEGILCPVANDMTEVAVIKN